MTGDVIRVVGEAPPFVRWATQGLWAWESRGEAVRLVNLESVCWKDELPEDKELESLLTDGPENKEGLLDWVWW